MSSADSNAMTQKGPLHLGWSLLLISPPPLAPCPTYLTRRWLPRCSSDGLLDVVRKQSLTFGRFIPTSSSARSVEASLCQTRQPLCLLAIWHSWQALPMPLLHLHIYPSYLLCRYNDPLLRFC
jgi:hypothetical protein